MSMFKAHALTQNLILAAMHKTDDENLTKLHNFLTTSTEDATYTFTNTLDETYTLARIEGRYAIGYAEDDYSGNPNTVTDLRMRLGYVNDIK